MRLSIRRMLSRGPSFLNTTPGLKAHVDDTAQKSNVQAMATELDNLSPTNIPDDSFNAEDRFRMKIEAWSSAVHAVTDSPVPTVVPVSDLQCNETSVLCSSSKVPKGSCLPKVVDLFSWDEVHSKKNGCIPPLIVGPDDIAGDRSLAPKQDGFMYYDMAATSLHTVISRRGIHIPHDDIALKTPRFFQEHAVRLFLEIPPVLGVTQESVYKYIGDYYIERTGTYLPREEWAKVKDKCVRRFIEQYSTTGDSFRIKNTYLEADARELLDKGNMLPLVLLYQTFKAEPEPLGATLLSPLKCQEDLVDVSGYYADHPYDSDSEYSQDSAPWEVDERSRFQEDTFGYPSPEDLLIASHEHAGAFVTQHTRTHAPHTDLTRYSFHSEDSNVFETSSIGDRTESDDDDTIETSLQRCALLALHLMQASQYDIQVFCEYLTNTPESHTVEGQWRLEIIKTVQCYTVPAIPLDCRFRNNDQDNDDDDALDGTHSDMTERLLWFDDLEDEPTVVTNEQIDNISYI